MLRYWIVKGKPKRNDFSAMLIPGKTGTWATKKPPKAWESDDRLFFWYSSPKLQLVGLGEFIEFEANPTSSGFTRFRVRYLSHLLRDPIGIDELRRDSTIGSASFLKSGAAGTVYPVSEKQGAQLFRLMCERDRALRSLWQDIS
jgi:EVE domain